MTKTDSIEQLKGLIALIENKKEKLSEDQELEIKAHLKSVKRLAEEDPRFYSIKQKVGRGAAYLFLLLLVLGMLMAKFVDNFSGIIANIYILGLFAYLIIIPIMKGNLANKILNSQNKIFQKIFK